MLYPKQFRSFWQAADHLAVILTKINTYGKMHTSIQVQVTTKTESFLDCVASYNSAVTKPDGLMLQVSMNMEHTM